MGNIETYDRAEIEAIAVIEHELAKRPVAGTYIIPSERVRNALVRRGLSVGRKGIYICMTQEAYKGWGDRVDIAANYSIYMVDDILKAFPEIHYRKEDSATLSFC